MFLEPVSLFNEAPGEFSTVDPAPKGAQASARPNAPRVGPDYSSTQYGIVTADERGQILSWSEFAEEMMGYTAEEIVGQNVRVLMSQADAGKHDGYLSKYLETGQQQMIGGGRLVIGVRKDGSVFPMDLILSEVVVGETRVYTGVFRDSSRRMTGERTIQQRETQLVARAEELSAAVDALAAQKDALESSNGELEQFAYVASHDLQEPLRKIQAFGSRLVSTDGANLSERGADYLKRMENAAERMQVLINDLLSYSRVRTRAKDPVMVDLGALVAGVLGDLEVAVEEADAEVVIGELPALLGDPIQLRQLFQNLLGNALKFRVPDRKPVIRVAASLSAGDGAMAFEAEFAPSERWSIVVEDNGIGFEAAYADRIFGIFQRLHGRSEYAGTGVGLAVCKKIVELHDGTIIAEATPGEGARFVMDFPKHEPDAEQLLRSA